jgi:hypothetical protein
MDRKMKFSVVLIAGLISVPASAYVYPSFYVVRSLARKHVAINNVTIKNKVTVFKRNGDFLTTFTESVSISENQLASGRILNSAGGEVATFARNLQSVRSGDLERPVAYDLLYINSSANIYEHFKALGLPLKTEGDLYAEKEGTLPYKPETTTAYGRLENKVAQVISPNHAERKPTDTSAPQLWVEKDSFLPLRAVFPSPPQSGYSSEPLEYRFSGYQVHSGKNFLYPRNFVIQRDGKPWVKIETTEIRDGTTAVANSTRVRDEASGDEREFLEMYLKWVR